MLISAIVLLMRFVVVDGPDPGGSACPLIEGGGPAGSGSCTAEPLVCDRIEFTYTASCAIPADCGLLLTCQASAEAIKVIYLLIDCDGDCSGPLPYLECQPIGGSQEQAVVPTQCRCLSQN